MKKIKSALISVYDKNGLEDIIRTLAKSNIVLYSTGGTQKFIEDLGYEVTSVESVTEYPSILGGRVKTLHPRIMGGILTRRENQNDNLECQKFEIPNIDLVIVNLYPFSETVKKNGSSHADIIEQIDIGGISLIRGSAKNYQDVLIVSNKNQYESIQELLDNQDCSSTLEQRLKFANAAFQDTSAYDHEIYTYFSQKIKS